jgi:hypothetical protein
MIRGYETKYHRQEERMTRITGLWHWQTLVSTHFAHLTRPQRTTLALWSLGIVLTQSAGLTTVTTCLALVLGQAEPAVRERLRTWYRRRRRARRAAQHAARRRYRQRDTTIQTCFAPLLRWVVAWWHPAHKQLPLALDASTLGQRFTILAICVVIRGCAIPVAWKVVEATRKGAWKPHWEALLKSLDGAVPADWTVIVLADRGLYAKWLYAAIQANRWHPFLRINRQGHYCLEGKTAFQLLSQVVTMHGQTWAGRVTCFKTRHRQLACTLLARWDAGYHDPWLIVTDLAPADADVAWYALRAWIECGFKDSKRGGWHWEQTKMVDPACAEWLWLALAVATLWSVAVGCAAEVAAEQSPIRRLVGGPATGTPRALSCFRRGQVTLLATLCLGQALPDAQLVPEPWPKSLDTPSTKKPSRNPRQRAT